MSEATNVSVAELEAENERLKRVADKMGKRIAQLRLKKMGYQIRLNDLYRAKDFGQARAELQEVIDRVKAERDELRQERNEARAVLVALSGYPCMDFGGHGEGQDTCFVHDGTGAWCPRCLARAVLPKKAENA